MASEGTVRIATASREAQQLSLVVGKSTVVDVPVPIKRASLADPQIADAIVLSPKQIYVTGKGYGTTNLTLWGKDDQVLAIFDLDVGVDLVRLKQHIAELLPDETNIHLRGHPRSRDAFRDGLERRAAASSAVSGRGLCAEESLNFLKVYPEPVGNPAPDVQTVTVEVIKGKLWAR